MDVGLNQIYWKSSRFEFLYIYIYIYIINVISKNAWCIDMSVCLCVYIKGLCVLVCVSVCVTQCVLVPCHAEIFHCGMFTEVLSFVVNVNSV